jgi:hypothetical protein
MPEYVVAMHFVLGPGRDVWLERQSNRVVSDAFIDRMGTELIRNDALFNAALVSFGSFGILHAVLIEAEPLYQLEAQRYRAPIDSRLQRTMRTLDFTDFDLPHDPEDLWHFELVFNPHDLDGGPYVRTMYKRKFDPDRPKPQMPGGVLGPGDGLLGIIGDLTESIPGTFFPSIVNHFVDQQLPIYGPVFGTPSEIFTLTTTRGRGMSMEFAVALKDTERVLELLTAAQPEIEVFAGVIALRYVKKSTATLGFTKFDISCTFEFNAASNGRTLAFYDRVWNDLEEERIPYTLHWGQQNNFTSERIVNMYGKPAVNEWKRARVTLLDPDMQEVFNSPFLEQCGLDDAGQPFIPV